jgi:hypothetical protein
MPASVEARATVDGVAPSGGCVRVIGHDDAYVSWFHVRAGGGIPLTITPGTVRIQLQDGCEEGQSHWAFVHPDPLVLAPGQRAELDLRVVLAEHDVRFVASPAQHGLADADVQVVTGLAPFEVVWKVHTDAQGSAHLRLPVGSVTFRHDLTGASRRIDWLTAPAGPVEVGLSGGN